jgi:hypothetical protein
VPSKFKNFEENFNKIHHERKYKRQASQEKIFATHLTKIILFWVNSY